MAILNIELTFDGISDEELSAVYDQTDAIKKSAEKAARKLPIGRFLTDVSSY